MTRKVIQPISKGIVSFRVHIPSRRNSLTEMAALQGGRQTCYPSFLPSLCQLGNGASICMSKQHFVFREQKEEEDEVPSMPSMPLAGDMYWKWVLQSVHGFPNRLMKCCYANRKGQELLFLLQSTFTSHTKCIYQVDEVHIWFPLTVLIEKSDSEGVKAL